MTINKTDLQDTSTFGTWKTRTNELLAFARKTVSIGTTSEENIGDIVLDGNIVLGATDTITVNNISKCSTGNFKITNAATVQGILTLDSGSGSASSVQFSNGGTPTWDISTPSNHSYLEIGNGTSFIRFDGTQIDGANIVINDSILPASITATTFTSSGTSATRSVFAEANISAGTILPTTLTCTGTGANKTTITEVDINAGTIDNAAIGATTQSTGRFTSVTTVDNGNITLGGTGQLRGDVAKADGTVLVNASTAHFNGSCDSVTGAGAEAILEIVYPVGSLFTTISNVAPSESVASGGLGFGNWARFAEGRTLVGSDSGSATVTAATFIERNSYDGQDTGGFSDIRGEYVMRLYFQDDPNAGIGVGDKIDLNVANVSITDSANHVNFSSATGNNGGNGFPVIYSSFGTTTAGVHNILVDVSDYVNSGAAASERAYWNAQSAVQQFVLSGGVALSSTTGFTVRNNRFRASGTAGGLSRVRLRTEELPDHIHKMKSPITNVQYYGFNDGNSAVNAATGNTLVATDEFLAQGPGKDNDGQYNKHTGLVHGTVGDGYVAGQAFGEIIATDVGDGHENMPPYETINIWKRIAD
ncbi:hypothetical protein N9091_00050 [bacterium]|nr:hypothetical protein [bacterium]